MLYYLYPLKRLFSPLNVFQYITFRSACAFMTALVISLLAGPGIIRWLKLKKNHKIRADTPAQHQAKSGTPAMGGLIIFLAMAGACLLWARLSDRFVLLFLATCTVLWLLGYADDYLKVSDGRKDGLSPAVKLGVQLTLAFGVAAYLFIDPPNAAQATSATRTGSRATAMLAPRRRPCAVRTAQGGGPCVVGSASARGAGRTSGSSTAINLPRKRRPRERESEREREKDAVPTPRV